MLAPVIDGVTTAGHRKLEFLLQGWIVVLFSLGIISWSGVALFIFAEKSRDF
jgi:hypothetical protein